MLKKTIFTSLLVSFLCLGACTNKNKESDAKEIAEDRNEKAIESTDQSNSNQREAKDDAEFVVESAECGLFEVEAGRLAATRAVNAKIKEFATSMVADHSKVNQELSSLASTLNIQIPTMLGEDKQKKLAELSSKTGSEFDRFYVETMIDEHQHDVDKFQTAAKSANNAALKDWAGITVPKLQEHLEHSKQIKNDIKDAEKAS